MQVADLMQQRMALVADPSTWSPNYLEDIKVGTDPSTYGMPEIPYWGPYVQPSASDLMIIKPKYGIWESLKYCECKRFLAQEMGKIIYIEINFLF